MKLLVQGNLGVWVFGYRTSTKLCTTTIIVLVPRHVTNIPSRPKKSGQLVQSLVLLRWRGGVRGAHHSSLTMCDACSNV